MSERLEASLDLLRCDVARHSSHLLELCIGQLLAGCVVCHVDWMDVVVAESEYLEVENHKQAVSRW